MSIDSESRFGIPAPDSKDSKKRELNLLTPMTFSGRGSRRFGRSRRGPRRGGLGLPSFPGLGSLQ